jgi:hypothetical protein
MKTDSMKKIAFVSLISFTILFKCVAQELSIGLKPSFLIVGARYTENPATTDNRISSRYSYAIGFTVSDHINKSFGITIEPRFIVKGYNFDWVSGVTSVQVIYRNNYFSMPVLFYVSPIHNVNFELGPEICYLISSKIKDYNINIFQSNEEPDQKQLEFSILTGITFSPSNKFGFGVRYGFGLTPFEKSYLARPFQYYYDYKIVQRYFEFSLDIRIFNKALNN